MKKKTPVSQDGPNAWINWPRSGLRSKRAVGNRLELTVKT